MAINVPSTDWSDGATSSTKFTKSNVVSTGFSSSAVKSTKFTKTSVVDTDWSDSNVYSTNWDKVAIFSDSYLLLTNGTDGLLLTDNTYLLGLT